MTIRDNSFIHRLAPRDLPLILGHRGAPLEAPENTIPSFRRAMELGADGVEMDVQLSRDGALMVFHDELLSRTTNGEGKLAAMTFAELRSLDAGDRFNRSFAGEKIPTLDEVLKVLPDGAVVDVEMKSETPEPEPLVQATLRTVRPHVPRLRLYISCFSPKFLDLAGAKGWQIADGRWPTACPAVPSIADCLSICNLKSAIFN